MRSFIRGAIAALTIALALTGCTSPATDRAKDTSATATVAAPPPDLMVNGVSMLHAAESARDLLHVHMTVRFVRDGEKVDCTLSGTPGVVNGSETDYAPYCDESYLAVPAKLADSWANTIPVVIWYEVAKQVARSEQDYRQNQNQSACAAAFVASYMPGYNNKADARRLLDYLKEKPGSDEDSFAEKGLDTALAGDPLDNCKS